MKRSGAASSMTIGGGVSGNGVGEGGGTGNHHQHHQGAGGTFSQRLNMDGQVRELKLGSTFNTRNTSTAFHTIKYDFKPASVDFNKVASFNVEPNNLVTVTVPNVESSGVPNTVYKGNHKKYTKECLLIIDRDTGVVTLEKLNHNILVKKTRAKGPSGPAPLPSLENSTKRISSKTKVSTGNRKTNSNIISAPPSASRSNNSVAVAGTSSVSQGMSPLQSSLGISGNTRSPIQAPEWKANAAQSTLPSVPMLLDDDDDALMSFPPQNLFAANQRQSQSPGASGSSSGGGGGVGGGSGNHRHKSQKKPQTPQQNHHHHHMLQQQPQQPLPPQQSQQQQLQQQSTFSNNYNNHSNNSSIFGGGGAAGAVSGTGSSGRSGDYSHLQVNGSNGSGGNSIDHMDIVMNSQVNNLNQEVGYLSSSSSSGSDSESSSDSDSSDSDSDGGVATTSHHQQATTGMSMPTVPMQMQSMPLVGGLMTSNGGELLHNDLQLSESESEEDSD